MAGRPRATGESAGERDSRQDLLEAAASLFIANGYAATSTRAIAEAAGLRQASLYHYFGGKDEILATLLEATVRPTLRLRFGNVPPLAKLWALCRFDIELLCGGPHNLGVLYLRPEISAPAFASFHSAHSALRDLYRTTVLAAGGSADAADLVFGLVEGVILTRQRKVITDVPAYASAGADACVRIVDASADLPAIRAALSVAR
ncbi:TetR/AcrR family transcriptional regulator [Kibdelosporangium lantanae]